MKLTPKTLANKLLFTTLISALLAAPMPGFAAEKVYKAGDKYSETGVSVGKNAYVVQVLSADLNKDKKAERIYLVANQFEKGALYYDQISYVIKDGKTGKRLVHVVKNEDGSLFSGYEPKVTATDLTRDGQNDLLLSAPTGGSGGMISYDLSSLKSGKLVSYLSPKDLSGLTLTGKYLDNYQVELYAKELDQRWLTDVSYNKAIYQENQIYDLSGKLLADVTPSAYPIGYLEVISAYDGPMLKANQRVTGIANADTIVNLSLYLSFDKGKWRLREVRQTSVIKAFE